MATTYDITGSPMALTQLPETLCCLLSGTLPESHQHQSIRLSSTGSNGWPYSAQLSLGEIIALSSQQLRFALWPGSTTTHNISADGRITLALVYDGAVVEIQAMAQKRQECITAQQLAVFDAKIRQVLIHRAPYATVTSGITFTLHDEEQAVTRWQQQIALLQALPTE